MPGAGEIPLRLSSEVLSVGCPQIRLRRSFCLSLRATQPVSTATSARSSSVSAAVQRCGLMWSRAEDLPWYSADR